VLKPIDRFRRDEDGIALVEYGVLVGFIAAVCFAAVQLLGTQIDAFFTFLTIALTPAL
jgi:Flp pilus assembly pilin Flp